LTLGLPSVRRPSRLADRNSAIAATKSYIHPAGQVVPLHVHSAFPHLLPRETISLT